MMLNVASQWWTFIVSLVVVLQVVQSITIEDRLAKMTLQEKVGQMVQIDISKFMVANTDTVDFDLMATWINDYKIGSILNSPFSGQQQLSGVSGWTAAQWREVIYNMQN